MGAELTLPRRALSVEDFHLAGEAGLFRPEERLELIAGDIITMAPIGWPHARMVNALTMAFSRQVGEGVIVQVQNPIILPPDNEPQPDLAILRPGSETKRSHPGAADTLLVIEVADTTLERDRAIKMPLYGRAGVPEAWLFDLRNEKVTIHRDPFELGYRTELINARDAVLTPLFDARIRIALEPLWRLVES